MKVLFILAIAISGTMAFAGLDDRLVQKEVEAHSKEMEAEALKSAKLLLDKKECEAGNNSPEERAQPVYKVQMIEGSFQGLYRFNTETQTAVGTFLVLKTCASGATQHLGDLNLEAGALVKTSATFDKNENLLEVTTIKSKEVQKALLKSLTEFQLYQ